MKLNNKQKSKIRREVDQELGHLPYKSNIHKNKKKYTRKAKHKTNTNKVG